MKSFVSVFLVLIIFSFSATTQDSGGKDAQEKNILKLVNSLPGVIKENAWHREHGVTVFLRAYIQIAPTKADKYYYVSISEEKGERLFTYDWYKVDPQTYAIRHYDMIEGKTIR
ncbi:MAG TPA: hypothetical protein VHA56_17070 [Mucilaginibacter sp.]|nr:hypothetical protein [Mucilaginibacter sp.]